MFVDWQCVYDDGSRPWDWGLPADQRRVLAVRAGEDVTIRVTLVNPQGAPYALSGDAVLALTARSQGPQSRQLVTEAAVLAEANRYTFSIAAADLARVHPQRGTFDVVAAGTTPPTRVVVIPLSEFRVDATDLGIVPTVPPP